jgi:hypothetical protein
MNERTPSREIYWSEIESRARDDAEAFECAKRAGTLRIQHGYPLLGMAVFAGIMMGLLLIMRWRSSMPTGSAQMVVLIAIALPCGIFVHRILTKRDRRRARIYLDHGLLPCPACGCHQPAKLRDGPCPGCCLKVTPGVVRHFWEHIARHGERHRWFGRDLLEIERTSNRANMLAFGVIVVGLAVSSDLAENVLGIPSAMVDAARIIGFFGGWLGLCAILWWDSWIMRGVRSTGELGDLRCCLHCRHDLRGLDERGICPECGTAYDIEYARARWLLKSRSRLSSHRRRLV